MSNPSTHHQEQMEKVKNDFLHFGFSSSPLTDHEILKCLQNGLTTEQTYRVACDVHGDFSFQESIEVELENNHKAMVEASLQRQAYIQRTSNSLSRFPYGTYVTHSMRSGFGMVVGLGNTASKTQSAEASRDPYNVALKVEWQDGTSFLCAPSNLTLL